MLSRDQILSSDDLKTIVLNVPEWGGDVRLSMMTGFARDRFELSNIGKNGGTDLVNIRAKLAAATIVDEDGNLMFSERDIVKLGKKSGAALNRIYDAAQKLNKITDEDVDELAKN